MNSKDTEHNFSRHDDEKPNNRILIIDDMDSIHADFKKILAGNTNRSNSLNALKANMLGEQASSRSALSYAVDTADQGEDGFELVKQAVAAGHPYAMAFVDMRMPPGWDGITTIENIWAVDPDIQIVICTAYTDFSWEAIQERLGQSDKLLILRKPFDTAEVCQLACSLTKKWHVTQKANQKMQELELLVEQRTVELRTTNRHLEHTNSTILEALQKKLQAENQLRHDATHDKLTSLPNRTLLMDRLDRCIERRKRCEEFKYGVLFMDLDNFKRVNDNLGHACGDELLICIARRIRNSLRLLDTVSRPGDDTTARIGGDEFVILLDGIRAYEDAKLIADRILSEVCRPVNLDGQEIAISASIGIATSQFDYEQADEVLRDADTAMYNSKKLGKDRSSIFDLQMRSTAIARFKLENDLRGATKAGEMHLQYQPIISLENGEIIAFEALVRWNHPEHGPISPAEFIPIAEESGSIYEIGDWVVLEASNQLAQWHREFPTKTTLAMNINFSAKQLVQDDLLGLLSRAHKSTGVDLRCIRIEVNESAVMGKNSSVCKIINGLKKLGVQIQMDDFGTGYSSMSIFESLPFDALKIDGLFIKGLHQSRQSAASVQAMIQLAHVHNLKVVAEGVETYDAMVQLQSLNCNYAQGYFFSKPLTSQAASELLYSDPCWARSAA